MIHSLKLPKTFPTEKAMNSAGQNIHNYEPEFWEFKYEINRYLKNLKTELLEKRYLDIVRNFKIYTEKRRDKIPICSFSSSWYWYRKEHQTRYEFYIRGLHLPVNPPNSSIDTPKLYSKRGSKFCDKIFRYGQYEFMEPFFKEGKIRISPAQVYKDGLIDNPRNDNELNKNRWIFKDNVKVQTIKGQDIPIKGDLQSTTSAPSYYLICFSTEFEQLLFDEFGYDACVIVHDPKALAERIQENVKGLLPGWYFIDTPVEYFDPHEMHSKNDLFSATICKDFSYAYQLEYRFIWDPLTLGYANDYINIQIGSLNDICEIYHK